MRSVIGPTVKRNKKEESLKKIKDLKFKIFSILFFFFSNLNTKHAIQNLSLKRLL